MPAGAFRLSRPAFCASMSTIPSREPPAALRLPLAGITVIALEQAVAAPLCTRQLADLGARVIKVERPGTGDFARHYDARVRGESSHFVWANRSKESLTLDLKQPTALAVLGALLERADVLVQNLAPGAADRLGLGFDALHSRLPRLIVCNVSGYGPDGPYRDKKAYDLMVQAEAGFLGITGTADTPVKAGVAIADIAAGMHAHAGILAALLQRAATGRGSRLDVAMLDCMVEWMGFPLYYALDGADPPSRAGAAHASIYPYGPFATGDGGIVLLGVQNEREWIAFCAQVLAQPELATDTRYATNVARSAARDSLRGRIEAAFATLTAEEVIARLERAQIANARMNTLREVWAHPQLAARQRWTEVDTPGGSVPALVPCGAPGAFDARMDPVPALGAHTDAILRELGHDADAIARLRAEGAV